VSDGSKNHTAGGGDTQEQGTGAAQATAGNVRLRAEEVIERGLRLYAQGDLIGAVAEWRRALEIDRSNRRARDYVSYVDDHFEVLSEKFRLAREQREAEPEPLVEPLGLAIEIEADDPMEDMSPYESIELEGSPGRAPSEEDDDSTSPAPGAPHVGGDAAGGKVGAGRRAWARRALARELDERWPMEESWPSASRSNDTLEMDVDPSVLDDLDDLVAAVAEGAEAAHAADDEADDDDVRVDEAPDDEGPDGDEGVSVEEPLDNYEPPSGQTIDDVLDAVDEEDTGPGESTQPSRPSLDRFGQRGLPTAEGSGRLDASRLAQAQRFAAALAEPDPLESDGEAWADGTPPIETVDRPGGDIERAGLSHLREDELREVRVTFRRSPRTSAPPVAAQLEPAAEVATDPAVDRDDAHDDEDAADRVEASDIVGEVDADRDDDGDLADGDLADGDLADGDLADGARDRADSEHDADDDQSDEIRARAARDSGSGEDDDYRDDRDEDDVDEEELTIERGGGVSSRVSQIRRRRMTATTAPPRRTTTPVPLRRTTTPVAVMRRTTAPVPPWASDGDRATTELTGRKRPMAHTAISIDLVSADLLAELAAAIDGTGTRADEQLRDRVGWLIDRARQENRDGRYPTAVVAVDLALDENPESAVVQKLIHSNRELFFEIYANYLGDLRAVPGVALPMSDIPVSELDHRAAFLLSRVDGVLSLEDVLDVAGMARLEAFRHLSRLMLRGILEIRP
jgi:hypothetical protein